MGIELEVVKHSVNYGLLFISIFLFLAINIAIINSIKEMQRNYPDEWKIYLVGFYLSNFVVSIGIYFLLNMKGN